MATKKTPAPLAAQAAKPVSETMQTYAVWIEKQTGYKVDPLSVQLGSVLRGKWQAEMRAQKQGAAAQAKPARRPRGSTIATREGVLIAEQRHVEVA